MLELIYFHSGRPLIYSTWLPHTPPNCTYASILLGVTLTLNVWNYSILTSLSLFCFMLERHVSVGWWCEACCCWSNRGLTMHSAHSCFRNEKHFSVSDLLLTNLCGALPGKGSYLFTDFSPGIDCCSVRMQFFLLLSLPVTNNPADASNWGRFTTRKRFSFWTGAV